MNILAKKVLKVVVPAFILSFLFQIRLWSSFWFLIYLKAIWSIKPLIIAIIFRELSDPEEVQLENKQIKDILQSYQASVKKENSLIKNALKWMEQSILDSKITPVLYSFLMIGFLIGVNFIFVEGLIGLIMILTFDFRLISMITYQKRLIESMFFKPTKIPRRHYEYQRFQ